MLENKTSAGSSCYALWSIPVPSCRTTSVFNAGRNFGHDANADTAGDRDKTATASWPIDLVTRIVFVISTVRSREERFRELDPANPRPKYSALGLHQPKNLVQRRRIATRGDIVVVDS